MTKLKLRMTVPTAAEGTSRERRITYGSIRFRILLIFIGLLAGAAIYVPAQQGDLYKDPRIETWSRDFNAGKRAEVVLAVEADLKSGSPHPSAAMAWIEIQETLGRTPEAPIADPRLRDALGILPDVDALHSKGQYKQLLEKYPASTVGGIKDVWALNLLAWSASYQGRDNDALAYATAMIRVRPDNFRAVWTTLEVYDDDDALYSKYLDLFKPDGEFGKTPAGRFLFPLMRNRSYATLDRLFLIDQWLERDPSDARAITFRADQLATLERYEDAAEAYAKAMTAFPFPLNWSENQARQLVRLRRQGEARELLKKYAGLKTKDAKAATLKAETEFGNALVNAGERGEARKVFESAIKNFPTDGDLQYNLANLELKAERAASALPYARKSVELDPDNLTKHLQLIEILRKLGKNQEALAAFQAADTKFKQKSTSLFFQGTETLQQMERLPEMLQLYERAVAEYPRSDWMQENYAFALDKNGKTAEALAVLRNRFDITAPGSWHVDRLREWIIKTASSEAEGKLKATAELEALRKRFPWDQELWNDADEQIDGDGKTERKLALWREAIAANPGQNWPWNKALWVLLTAERWDEAEKLTDEALGAMASNELPNATSLALYDRAMVIVEQAEKGSISRERLEEGLARFEVYRKTGSYLTAYHRWRATILEGLGRKRDAAGSMLEAAELSPDDYSLLFDFVTKYSREFGDGRRMSYFQHYVDRDPYNGTRLRNLMHLLVMWYGSPAYAIQIDKKIKEHAPDQQSRYWEAMAWGKIGDSARDFNNRYGKETNIGESDRYISWFEGARRKAQRGRVEVGFDEKDPLIYQVTHPDGSVVRRKQHPLSGKFMLLQVGAAKIECEYDEYGDNLKSISDSSGKRVQLSYYPDDTIEKIISSDGRELTFVYNQNKKPVSITANGVGTINVTYKPDNEIDKVESTGGASVALKITSAFQELLGLTNAFSANSDVTRIPELPFVDAELDKLRAASRTARVEPVNTAIERAAARAAANVAVAKYLVEHIADRRGYADEVRVILPPIIEQPQKEQATPQANALAIESIGLWHQLLLVTRKNGLSSEDFTAWSEMRDWLGAMSKLPGPNQSAAQSTFREVEAKSLSLLKSAAWLPNSYLNSPGYWRKFTFGDLLPQTLRGNVQLNDVLVRRNSEVVVGTDKGLLVLRRGFWEWFGFDEARGRFSATVSTTRLNAASNILSLAEDARGELLVGTANGLVKLGDAYDGEARRFLTAEDGLPTARVDSLITAGEEVLIGTTSGLYGLQGGAIKPLPEFAAQKIEFLRSGRDATLIGMAQGVSARHLDRQLPTIRLSDKPASDALWVSDQEKVFILRAGEIFTLDWDGRTTPGGGETYLQIQNQVVKTNKIYGFAFLPLDGDASGVAVMTDRGLSIFRDAHFEHKDLPQADKGVGVYNMDELDKRTYMLTSDGVYVLERGQVGGDSNGRVYDLLTADDLGLTFVARGTSLEVVRHANSSAGATQFGNVAASRLARDREGRLIANDGFQIVRFEKGSIEPVELFSADPLRAEGFDAPSLTSILAASDGTIWVTAGASVFRWKNGRAEEYSIFKDSTKFPSRTHMISRVVETHDGRIWVIASDEGHLFFKGQKLQGGVLEWNGNGFHRLDFAPSFITGYTKIGDRSAIVGTSHGFVQHRAENYSSFTGLKDASYKHLIERQPMLWLGTRGANLGGDVWLFGTAGGIVAYRSGEWFYPDALNYKLPDDHLYAGNYGVRAVHAVETDKAGHIYAGTDRGLLIYDSGGGDATAFLISNHYEREYAFRLAEQRKLQQEANIILSALPKESELAKKVEQVRTAEREIDEIRKKILPGVQFVPADRIVKNEDPNKTGLTGDKLIAALGANEQLRFAQALEAKEKAKNELLGAIQKDNPSLYQLLELKPLDLKSLRENLKPEQAVLQYLPTDKNLYIQIVTRESAEIREVQVRESDLQQRALQTARGLSRGSGVRKRVDPLVSNEPASANFQDDLAWLYDQLLRPVENDLAGRTQVFVVPVGNLSYVPFAALIRSREPKIEYAVQHFNFGYLPSMYLFDLVMRSKPSTLTASLIFGDPDGSLPGARNEAESVFQLVGGGQKPYLGEAATYETLRAKAGQARILHLATHGRFVKPTAEESYLLLANNKRLSIFEAMMLPLDGTEMVVLSACETGLSTQGLEYATLTRAFAQAGSPATVATLWQVNDESSKQLMEKFYLHLKTKDRFTALADAQKEMLTTPLNDPSSWAGYIPFGKP